MKDILRSFLKNKLVRWLLLFPLILIYYVFAKQILFMFITHAYSIIFPVNGFIGFLFASFGISLIMSFLSYFFIWLNALINLTPNKVICSRIIFVVIIAPLVVYYYGIPFVWDGLDFKTEFIIDILTALYLFFKLFEKRFEDQG